MSGITEHYKRSCLWFTERILRRFCVCVCVCVLKKSNIKPQAIAKLSINSIHKLYCKIQWSNVNLSNDVVNNSTSLSKFVCFLSSISLFFLFLSGSTGYWRVEICIWFQRSAGNRVNASNKSSVMHTNNQSHCVTHIQANRMPTWP